MSLPRRALFDSIILIGGVGFIYCVEMHFRANEIRVSAQNVEKRPFNQYSE